MAKSRLQLMKRSRYVLAICFVAAVTLSVGLAALGPRQFVYLRSAAPIESFLREQTPLGSHRDRVRAWLESEGLQFEIDERDVVPDNDYPLSKNGGKSFIFVIVARYRFIFHTSVEAFYTFDDRARLTEIRVRKTTDSF
jgi:hypothetical protein